MVSKYDYAEILDPSPSGAREHLSQQRDGTIEVLSIVLLQVRDYGGRWMR